jgi:single-stranded-DNA-specific exonuclease
MVQQRDGAEKLIMVQHPDWQPGVVGLVAGRLCEEFHRPAIAIAQLDGSSRGSARSIKQFDIYEALCLCRDEGLFEGGRMGGHAAAAGFTIRNENIPALHEQLLELAESMLDDEQLTPDLSADIELTLDQCTLATLLEVQRLEPFGMGNSAPLFVARNLQVLDAAPFSEASPHLRLRLGTAAGADGPTIEAAAFNRAAEWAKMLAAKPLIDVMFALEARTWKDETTLRLAVKELRVSKGQA